MKIKLDKAKVSCYIADNKDKGHDQDEQKALEIAQFPSLVALLH